MVRGGVSGDALHTDQTSPTTKDSTRMFNMKTKQDDRPTGADTGAAVRAEEITKTYGEGEAEVRALCTVSMEVASGEFVAVMGPSGSGKSTLMHLLAGLDRPTEGNVYIEGENVTTMNDKSLTMLRRKRVGFIFQAFNLIPQLTAEENIVLPLTLGGSKANGNLDMLLDQVGLTDRRTHKPTELSGGQQQRVAVARALITEPAVVFADEPTGNLDSKSSNDILGLLRKAADERGQTTVMVTHEAHAAAYADRVVFLADGKIVRELRNPTEETVLETIKDVSA
jgi:putative ABC transport system ATP-binding protein